MEMMSVDRRIFDVINALYEAATDHRKWQLPLRLASELFNADGGHLGHFDQHSPLFNVSILYSSGGLHWDEKLQEKFEKLIPEDPRLNECLRLPGKPISCRMAMSDDDLHESRMYKEVLQ